MRNETNMAVSIGTSSIVDEKTHEPILSILTLIVETVAKLRKDGHRVVLVSSGAVGVGLRRMNVNERPSYLPRIQVWPFRTDAEWASAHGRACEFGMELIERYLGACCRWPVSADESVG